MQLIPFRLDHQFGYVVVVNHRFDSGTALAASLMAVVIRWYVPHRQMFPFMARMISRSDGSGVFCRSATAERIIPEVQYAHCMASALRNASWTGCRWPFFSNPSMVVTAFCPT